MNAFTSIQNSRPSFVAHAASARAALLQRIDQADRHSTAGEQDQMDTWAEAIAFTPAVDRADADHKLRLVMECIDHDNDGLLSSHGAAILNAALASAVVAYQGG